MRSPTTRMMNPQDQRAMKSKTFPKDWQIILFAIILFFLAMQSCKTIKDIHRSETRTDSLVKKSEQVHSESQAQTNTNTKITSENQIQEDCDTNVNVMVPVVIRDSAGISKTEYQSVLVPVKFHRTINQKQYTEQNEQKKESGSTVSSKNELNHTQTTRIVKDKSVERFSMPWWMWALIISGVIAAIIFILWRFKFFG